ncbi:HK97 gp10 family phage protein [Siccibacter colletis]|uniref:HK97 gp10 family phage protein n=1 Tax=Siccibacter colletis TaxID=1505757 RepID=A0ABY6J930_9ENTR|nr:HK97 gp10 family phage protein [Siccibacter colletis]UYU30274.1 HK97 gp10 family phage protein [Siccibacter colletis]
MAGKVRGIMAAQAQMETIIKEVSGKKAVRGIQSALLILSAASAKEVPRDTSYLLNSQFRQIDFNGTRITGKVGYSASYAAAVHEAPGKYLNTQTDRPVRRGEAEGSRGVIWGPNGNPKFLYYPAKDNEEEMLAIIRKEMKL